MSDRWAEAYGRLVMALEFAREAGFNEQEALDAVGDVYGETLTPHVGGGPKRPKKAS